MDICSEDDDDGTPPMEDEVPNNMMDPHGDSSHSGNSSLSAKKSSHLLLILLLILLCMKPVICSSPSKPMFEASKAVINSTAMSFSACALPLKECPKSGKEKEKHIWCIRDFQEKSCPLGYDYMCGKEKSGYLVEGCFERSSCPIGTANEIHFNPETKQASLSCEECPKDLIQPWPHDSSRIFRSGCQQNRVPLSIHTQKDRMKMVYDGHPREEDQYICDTSQGYSDISGNLLCNANTLCTCEKKVVCQNHLELLPNGKCKPICAEERVMPDFSCDKFVSEDSTSIPPSSTGATSSGEDLHGTATDSAQGSADATPVLQSSDGGGFAVGFIILIIGNPYLIVGG